MSAGRIRVNPPVDQARKGGQRSKTCDVNRSVEIQTNAQRAAANQS
jgi:hypothetical protein